MKKANVKKQIWGEFYGFSLAGILTICKMFSEITRNLQNAILFTGMFLFRLNPLTPEFNIQCQCNSLTVPTINVIPTGWESSFALICNTYHCEVLYIMVIIKLYYSKVLHSEPLEWRSLGKQS